MRGSVLVLAGLAALSGCSSSDSKPTGGGGTGGAPAEAGREAGVQFPCKAPESILGIVDQQPTGFVRCKNSVVDVYHRTEIKACESLLPRTLACHGVGSGTDAGIQLGLCGSDSDCKTGPEGYCTTTQRNASCSCYYGCKADSDCPPGNICECGNPTGQCKPAHCTSDAQCAPGFLCLSSSDGGCGTVYACQTAKDLCAGDLDCNKFPEYSQCAFTGDHRECVIPKNCGF